MPLQHINGPPTLEEDHYESALQELLEKKQKGQPISTAKKAPPSNVYNLMDALRASIKGDQRTAAEKPAKAAKKAKPAKAAASPRGQARAFRLYLPVSPQGLPRDSNWPVRSPLQSTSRASS